MSELIWHLLATGTPCATHGSTQKQKKYTGKITIMQILYLVMQWKPHSCILYMITNFDIKCKAWFLRSSSAQVTLPTKAWGYWNQWGMIGIQSEPWGSFHYQKYFHMINKCHSIWKWATWKTRFQHNSCIGVYGKYLQVERRKIKRWSIYWGMHPSIGNTWAPVKIRDIADYCTD